MASKVVITSRNLWSRMTKMIFHSPPQTPGHILQHHLSPTSISSKALSSFIPATFFANSSSDMKIETFRPISSLNTCGNQGQGTVLTNCLKPNLLQVRNYKNAIRPRLICDGCYFVWRHGRKFVECSDHPRHKQMKRLITRKVWQEDYSKGHIYKALNWHKRFPQEFLRTADRTSLSHNWLAGKLGKEV